MPRVWFALIVGAAFLAGFLAPKPVLATSHIAGCCAYQDCYRDADNDTFTIGGASSQCADPGCPSGWRTGGSANPDCDDNNPAVGYIPAQSCPTTCGYPGGTVPDGNCGTTTCPATGSCYSQGYYQAYYYGQGYYYNQGYYYGQSGYYAQSYYQGYYYGQSYYYGQIWYYGEPGYYGQGYYYGQIWYYGEPGYYGQGSYCCECCPSCFC